MRRRAELYYQQRDALAIFRQEVRRDLLAEGRKHSTTHVLSERVQLILTATGDTIFLSLLALVDCQKLSAPAIPALGSGSDSW